MSYLDSRLRALVSGIFIRKVCIVIPAKAGIHAESQNIHALAESRRSPKAIL